jgi:hypothetical protein
MAYPAPPEIFPATGEPEKVRVRDFLLDIASRKEFRSLAPAPLQSETSDAPKTYGYGLPSGPLAPDSPLVPGLRLHGAQVFVRNFSNPDTPYSRLLLNWQTGTGKTIGAIAIAQEYIRQYKARLTTPPVDRPTVYIIGFTKSIIQSEMLRHPEFGFITPSEILDLERLRVLAEKSGTGTSTAARHYGGYLGVLKRRITDRSRGGYYRFYGYKEFANRLFVVTQLGTSKEFTVASLYARKADKDEDLPDETFLQRMDAAVKNGYVEINKELLKSMRGGIIVADEIHNTYNIRAKNNYGIAIQYALDKIEATRPKDAPRVVYMTATVTGGVATEIVDLLNFLVPVSQLPGKKHLRRADFFRTTVGPGGKRRPELLPGALERIGKLSAGRVSFLLDTDEASYPRRVFEGVALDDPLKGGEKIAYLKFTPCPMAPYHEKTLELMLREREERIQDSGKRADARIPANAYTLYDMVYPNPEYPADAARKTTKDSPSHGLYLSGSTPLKLAGAPAKWRAAAGVTVEPLKGETAGGPSLISGPFLDLARRGPPVPPGIEFYSAKYKKVGDSVLQILGAGPGKIMIYHHRVRMSGVLQIRELLETNGFLDEVSSPSPSTICAVCGVPRRKHTKTRAAKTWKGFHSFTPARYVIAHSEIDRSVIDKSLARYNSQTNSEGFEFRVLIGSKLIREGFDLKAVQHQLITSLPTDIPTLIQVFGRVARKNSHAGLPENQRAVKIQIFVSTAGEYTNGKGPAPEVMRYSEKMESYFLTQKVEKAIRRYAVDAFINYEKIMAADPAMANTSSLDMIPYRPEVGLSEVKDLPVLKTTYNAYGYGDEEIEIVTMAVQALFTIQPVWKYEDLWAAVKSGTVGGIAQNPATFSEDSYALALDTLCRHDPRMSKDVGNLPDRGFRVSRVGDFYVRSPAKKDGQPLLDVESYVRDNVVLSPVRIQVADYVATFRRGANFDIRLAQFEQEFAVPESRIEDALVLYDSTFHYALLRALVEGAGGSKSSRVRALWDKAQQSDTTLARALQLYRRFKVIVTEDAVATRPDAKRLVQAAKTLRKGSARPVGFIGETSVKMYGDKGWYDIPHDAMGIAERYVENDTVIGYVEMKGSRLRFKVRPPLHALAKSKVRDIRSLARGAVCETRGWKEQEKLVLSLRAKAGGRVPKSSQDLKGLSSADLCVAIRLRLLALEEAARNRKNGMKAGVRWFYLFNERLPTIRLLR